MASGNQNYYTNPAFCQQSEFYSQRTRALSPERRQTPIGGYKPVANERYQHNVRGNEIPPPIGPKPKTLQRSNSVHTKNYNDNEDEGEEIFIDDPLPEEVARDNQKYLDISNGNVNQNRYNYINGNEYPGNDKIVRNSTKGRYAVIPSDEEELESPRSPKHRYEYIPMQEQANGYPSSPRKQIVKPVMQQEEVQIVGGRMHRYSVIPGDEENTEITTKRTRYALVPVDEIKPNSRYAVIPTDEVPRNTGRYDYIPENRQHRRPSTLDLYVHSTPIKSVTSPQTPRKGNPIATQKLHELLTTPKKFQRTPVPQNTPQKILSPQSQQKVTSPQSMDPFRTPNKSPPKVIRHQTPKAQQKLNYTLSTRQAVQENKRHTAVIAPICSSPVQSVYSETTFSQKTESWMNLSMQKPPAQATLAVAAIMMTLCGGLTSGLCFYMISVVGRMYYLDFGIISGFACFLLGLLGFRSRNCHWLPNRNYISGYIVLSAFSLLTCAGLLVLLSLQPKPGSPLADVTSGAVCGISGLSLVLASAGVIASYCCKYPPPDNRVQHCAPGFTV